MDNNKLQEISSEPGLGNFIRVWHLAMIALCLAACLTGELADDYKKLAHENPYC